MDLRISADYFNNNIRTKNMRGWVDQSKIDDMLKNPYQSEALKFLYDTETSCDIHFVGLNRAKWSKSDINTYSVTLTNKRGSYTFRFYDSVNNTEKKIYATLDFYSVLACLSVGMPLDFDDFCSEYGYIFNTEREYLSVKQTYIDCLDQEKSLQKLFNSDQLDQLNSIN